MILFAYNACRLLSLTVLTSLPPQPVPFFLTDLFPIFRSFCFIDCPSWITEGSLSPGSLGRGACCTVHPMTESTEKNWAVYSQVPNITYGPRPRPSSARAFVIIQLNLGVPPSSVHTSASTQDVSDTGPWVSLRGLGTVRREAMPVSSQQTRGPPRRQSSTSDLSNPTGDLSLFSPA